MHAQQVPGGSRRCSLARLQRRAVCTFSLAAVVLALAPGASSASFRPLGSALNLNPARGARATSIAAVGGVPYVARVETNSASGEEVHVARFDGSGWVEVGGALNFDVTHFVLPPSIAAVNGEPYVAWTEGTGTSGRALLHVKRFDGTNWLQVGSTLNIDTSRPASAPRIASIGENAFNPGVPFVTWSESDGTAHQIQVKRYDGATSTWASVGSALNVNTSLDGSTPDIASIGGTVLSGGTAYVTWRETSASGEQIRVKRLNGTSWESVGSDPLNVDPAKQAQLPAIANIGGFVGGIPYVTWTEFNGTAKQVRLAKFSGSTWSPVGGSLNADAAHDAFVGGIENVGGQPYVAFSEYIGLVGQLHVTRVGDSGPVGVGGVLNADPARSAVASSIANVGGAADVSWEEADSGGIIQARVAREVAPVCNDTSVSVAHDTPAVVPLPCNEGTREIVAAPAHGALSAIDQAAGTVTYTPSSGYGGADSFSFRSSDGTLDSSAATAGLDVAAAVVPPVVPIVAAATLTNLTLAPAKFRAAAKGISMAAKRRRASIGTRVGYTLDRAATTTFTVIRLRPGIRKGKRCVAPPRRKARGPKPKRCTRTRRVGSFTRVSPAGVNQLRFTGRVGGKSLALGRYRLTATAQVAGAKISNALTKPFRIVR